MIVLLTPWERVFMLGAGLLRKIIGFKSPEDIEYFKSNRILKPKELGVVTCYFNSEHYESRKSNFEKFYQNYQNQFSRIPLLVIELAFGEDEFELSHIPGVLQIRTRDILWQKERLLSIGINQFIQESYLNVAWIDCDVLFTDSNWPEKALDALDTNYLCQLFSQSIREEEMHLKWSARNGVVKNYLNEGSIHLIGLSCGYAWAAKSDFLRNNPLYDVAILGGGDAALWLGALCYGNYKRWLKNVSRISFFQSLGPELKKHFLNWAIHFGEQVQGRVGYVEQQVISLYHGKTVNRLYSTRYFHIPHFNPQNDLQRDENGCWSWNQHVNSMMRDKVKLYFFLRKEDEPLKAKKTIFKPIDHQARKQMEMNFIEKPNLKLCIQIPCYNEELTLLETITSIPRALEGIDKIEIVVIDDGSTDQTASVAKFAGVNHVIRIKTHRGLANAFKVGIQKCLSLGADIIVNIDGDNQYPSEYIVALIRPILQGRADMVLGARRFNDIPEFSRLKIIFQRLGSFILSKICRVKIPDAATGFRAFTREAALKLNIFTKYTYTLETLIQATQNGEKIISIPIHTNRSVRPSRLITHPSIYVIRSCGAVIRLVLLYNPLRVMSFISMVFLGITALLFYYHLLAAYFILILSFLIFGIGLILDQISVNRKLLEAIQHKMD